MTAATFDRLPTTRRLTRGALLGRTALCGVLSVGVAVSLAARPAKAEPAGGAVVQGGATIQQSGTHTEITQSTQRAVLTWQDFSIGSAESVNFAQPNTDAVALNRVLSKIPSDIQGQLTANGQVWIINPNGVFVGKNAAVNVGGLIATSSELVEQDWDAGKYTFAGASADSQVNIAGSVTATDGSIVLVAPLTDVSGSLSAAGDVAVGAGSGFSVDFHGDGLTRFAVDGASGARLNVSGTISAQGGAAYLVAAATDAVEDSVVSIGGQVEASRIEERGGVIVISGGETGVTEISGTVDASQTEGAGGSVTISGGRIALTETARIDASGATGGGRVEIGGAFQGGALASDVVSFAGAPESAPLPTAKRTYVAEGAQIAANAGEAGDGGTVIVWSDEITAFYGNLSATGGATGGNGGFAEVSGKENLAFDGIFDLSAPAGVAGELLLDPNNITLVAVGANDALLADNQVLFGEPDAVTNISISAGALDSASNVTLQANGDIIVNSTVLHFGTGGLIFEADNNVTINQSVFSNGFLDFTANFDNAGGGSITMAAATTLSSAGDISLAGDTATLNTVSSSGAVDISAGDIALLGGTLFAADGVTISNPGGGIGFGGTAVDGFQLTDTEADLINSALTLDAAGDITVDNVTFDQVTTLTAIGTVDFLNNSSTFDQALTAAGSEIDIDAGVNLTVANDNVLSLVNSEGDGVDFGGNDTGNPAAFTIGNDDLGRITATNLAVRSSGGTVTVDASNGGGSDFDLTAFASVELEGTDINISENDQVVVGADGTGTFAVTQGNDTGDIFIGGNGTGLSLSDAEIGKIEAATLTATTRQGDIEVQEIAFSGDAADVLQLFAAGGRVFFNETGGGGDGDAITGLDQLDVSAADVDVNTDLTITMNGGGTVNLTNAENDLVTLGTSSGTDGTFDLTGGETDRFDTETLTVTTAANIILDGASADNATDLVLNAGTGVAVNGASELNNNLIVNSAGAISQTAALTVDGTTDINAAGQTVTLDHDDNDFDGAVDVEAATVSLDDADTITLGEVTVTGTLTVEADEEITQNGDGITVAGAATLTGGGGNITLDGPGNDFDSDGSGDAVNVVSGDNVSLRDANAIILGNVNLSGDLTVQADGSGTITQTAGTSVTTAGGTTDLIAEDDTVTLDNSGNDFNVVDATASDVILRDTNAIALHDVTATNNLIVTAEGTITDADGGTMDVGGATTLTANDAGNFFDIVLDNATQDFASLTAEGEDITISQNGDLALGSLTLHAADGSADGTVAGNTGSLSATANGGNITQTAALVVPGTATFAAVSNDITLTDGGNNFIGAVNADANNITLFDAGVITLGDIDAANDLIVTTGLFGGIDDGAQTAADQDVNVTGTATLISPLGNIALNDLTNDFVGGVNAAGLSVSLGDANSITLLDIDALGSLTVNAATGSIDDGAETALTADINVGGATTLTAATTVTADDTTNDFSGAVSASGTDIVINDANTLTTGLISASGTVTLGAANFVVTGTVDTPTATLTDPNGLGFALGDSVNAPGGRIPVNSAEANLFTGDVIFTSASDFRIGGFTFNDGNALTSRTATIEAGTSVLFDGLFTTAAFFEADLDITAPGGVSQGFFDGFAFDNVTVTGVTSIDATGAPITLDRALNDFIGATNAAGTEIALFDANDLVLGDIDATGSLAAFASGGGALTDNGALAAGDGINVGTTTFVSAITVTLDDAVNDFVGAVSASGTNVTLQDANAITLADVDVTNLTVDAATSIDDGAAVGLNADVNVTGTATLTAGTTITLDDAFNNFVFVHASGNNVVLRDADSITLADIEAAGDLTVIAAAAISDGASGDNVFGVSSDVDVAGTTTLTAGTTITMDDTGNDFTGAVTASGTNISLRDQNSITLGDIDAGGALVVDANGAIDDGEETALTGDVNVTGATTLTAVNDIMLNDGTNDFSGPVDANSSAGSITLGDANALILGTIDTGNDLTATTGGSVTDTAGRTIAVGGHTSITAESGGNFFDVVLDNPGTPTDIDAGGVNPAPALHDFNSIEVAGEDILVRDVNAITVNASGNSDGSSDTTLNASYTVLVDNGLTQQKPTISPNGSVVVLSGTNPDDGDMTIQQVTADQDILLSTSGDFIILPDGVGGANHDGVPLHSESGDIWLVALNGSFKYHDLDNLADAYSGASDPSAIAALPGAENLIPAGTMFDAPDGNIAIIVRDAFKVIVTEGNSPLNDPAAPAEPSDPVLPDGYENNAFVLNTDRDGVALISVLDGEIAVGSIPIIEGVLTEGGEFEALGALGTLSASFQDLFVATGNLALESRNLAAPANPDDTSVSFFVENTASSIGDGAGTRIIGVTYLGGFWENIGVFGSFNGIQGQTAALSGFITEQGGAPPPGGRALQLSGDGAQIVTDLGDFVINPRNTANACIIGLLSSCQPLGRVILLLEVEDGSLLAFRFFDEEEEEDDQFSNRGDEEDWQ